MEKLHHITWGSTFHPRGNPLHFFFDTNSSRSKVTVWAGLCGNGVIVGTYGIAYLTMLNENIIPALIQEFDNQFTYEMFQHLWWVQDGALAHRLVSVVGARWCTCTQVSWGDNSDTWNIRRVMGINHDVQWPARKKNFRKRENQSLLGKPILIGKTNRYRENKSLSRKPILIAKTNPYRENQSLSGKQILCFPTKTNPYCENQSLSGKPILCWTNNMRQHLISVRHCCQRTFRSCNAFKVWKILLSWSHIFLNGCALITIKCVKGKTD